MHTPDMRLLQVFNEVYRTRSVSRAAEQLTLGQPAVSIALAKLREHFDNPLFVRIGHSMQPTQLAEELAQPISHALTALDVALNYRSEFDPTSSQRRFCISMTDISQLVLLPKLWAALRPQAPGIHIDVMPLSENIPRLMAQGEVDLTLGFIPQLEAGFYQQSLFRQNYICLASADHPRLQHGLTLAQYEAEKHAVVSSPGTGHLMLEKEIEIQGIQRNIVLRVPNFLGIAFVMEQTDMLATIPQRLGEVLAGRGKFRTFPVPFPVPEYAVKQHWHERYHHDAGNRWLRQMISDLLSSPANT